MIIIQSSNGALLPPIIPTSPGMLLIVTRCIINNNETLHHSFSRLFWDIVRGCFSRVNKSLQQVRVHMLPWRPVVMSLSWFCSARKKWKK